MKIYFLTFCILLIDEVDLYAQAGIAVRGTYAREEIEAQAIFYAHALGLDEQVHIIISFTHEIDADQSGFTQYRDATVFGGGHQIYICINRRKGRSHQMMTLAHEMIHARQFVVGKLKQCNGYQYSWQGNPCSDPRDTAYHERPWEKEAHTASIKLYNAYKDHSLMAIRTRQNGL
jgi:hypothetical protein